MAISACLLLLSLLHCVVPGSLTICEETSQQATYGGYIYRTLLNATLTSKDESGAKFEEHDAVWPTGWHIAPSQPDIAANVIAVHNWQCQRLVTNSTAYATGIQLDPAPGIATDFGPPWLWEETGDSTYLSVVNQRDDNHLYRLLLRKSCETPTTTSTATTLFSPCGATGRIGPIQSQCDTAYHSKNTVLVDSGYQEWSVPLTSQYSIEARGAQGGNHGDEPGGFGALASGIFALTEGDRLLMVVGQAGLSSATGGSGGGGTFVAKIVDSGGDAFTLASPLSDVRVELLVAAGGGAGVLTSLTPAAGGRGIVDSVSVESGGVGGGGGFKLDVDGGCYLADGRAESFLCSSTGGGGSVLEEQGGFGGGGHPGAPGGGGGGYEGGFCGAEACLGGTSFGATAIAAINEGDGSVAITQITTTTTTSFTETNTSITSTASTTTSATRTTSTGTATTVTTTTNSTSTTSVSTHTSTTSLTTNTATSTTTTKSSTTTFTTTTTASNTTTTTNSSTTTLTTTITASNTTTTTRTVSTSTTHTTGTTTEASTSTATATQTGTITTPATNGGSSTTTSVSTFTTTSPPTTSTTAAATVSTTTTAKTSTTTAFTTVTTSSLAVTSFTVADSTSTISVTGITTSTTGSGTAGEMQVDQAVADLHGTVSEVAQGLLASHTADSSQTVSQTITQGGAMITVVVATVNAAAANGGSVSINVPTAVDGEFAQSVRVPQAVLEQALTHAGVSSGPVALAATSLDGGFTAAMQHAAGEDLQVLGQPLSITILTVDGTLLSGVQLAEPIEFTLLEQAPSGAQCAYWDETQSTWSSEGVERVGAPGEAGQLVCATNHLTIFAGVLVLIADIADILECSTAETIFSLNGLKTLVHGGDWWRAAPTIMVWGWLAIFVAIFALARRRDLGRPQAFPWDLDTEEELPANRIDDDQESPANEHAQSETEGAAAEAKSPSRSDTIRQSLGEVGGRTGLQVACDCCAAILNLPNVFTIFIFELPEAPKKVVSNCVHRVHAYKSGIDEDSLHTVKQVVFAAGGQEQLNIVPNASTPPRTSLRSGESSTSLNRNFHRAASGLAEAKEVHKKGRTAVDSFLGASCPRRAVVLFPAVHPWVHIFSYSMFVPHTARVAMLMMKIFGSVAVSALFLSAAGGMLSPDSPIECAPDDLRGQLVEAVFVGMVSAIFSDGIVAILFALRRETVAVGLDQAALARQRALWKLRMRIFWIVAICHLSLSIYVVVVFLANVSSNDIDEWGLTAAFTLVQDFLVMPLLVAFLLSSLASLVMWCRPSIRDSAMQSTLLQSKVATASVPPTLQVEAGEKDVEEVPGSQWSDPFRNYQSGGDASTEAELPSVGAQRSGPRPQSSRTSKVSSHDSTSFEARRHKIIDSL